MRMVREGLFVLTRSKDFPLCSLTLSSLSAIMPIETNEARMALTKAQKEQIAANVFASSLGWLAFESLGNFSKAIGVTAPADKKELLALICKVTGAREARARYADGTEFKCLVGIVIHPEHDAVPLSRAGQSWTLFWPSNIEASFNETKQTWE